MLFAKGHMLKIEEEKCMNQLYSGVECTHCVNHCPAEAILILDSHVYIDKDLCNGCGLCLSDCPTQVFTSAQWDETSIVRDIDEEGWKTTEFFCGRHTAPYQREKDRDRGAIQLPVCLSSVSKGAWFEIGLKTAVENHLDQCQGCPMAKTISSLEFKVRTAVEWLESIGHRPKFNFLHQGNDVKKKRSLEAIESGQKVTSRRDLFLALTQKVRQTNEKAKGCALDTVQEKRGTYLTDWQKRLADIFSANTIEGSPPAYWPSIIISNVCVQCGMCAKFCPSGALKITVENGICTYSFTSGLCLDCRICQLSCPSQAIQKDRICVSKPFLAETVQISPVITCRRCSRVTFDHPEKLCYWCREETSIADSFHETCKKLLLDAL
ncbi:4Fe-4S binding protein [Dehalobacter sp. DCM]|uniref:4Fe-4S binding protein n=1 Tax=Dehalobacter sp. DCM TaxID=2907827 RepID=UPI003081C6E7|nr:4Fe-4S binding protein [Dehalobacter sp. DCM]